jgi:hypothetical protein
LGIGDRAAWIGMVEMPRLGEVTLDSSTSGPLLTHPGHAVAKPPISA